SARVEAERIGHAQGGPLSRAWIEREQRVRVGSIGERGVGAEPRDVELVHPVVIVKVGRHVGTSELGAIGLIKRPAVTALAAVGLLRASEVLALAHVEAGEVAASR